VITDLVQVRLLGEKKRDENLHFRRFMKSRDHSDRILRRIAEGIEDRIDCTQCAQCCRVATVQVSERDVERLARYLRIPRDRFLADYTMESAEEGRILKRTESAGCVFLDGNTCTAYEARPDICQRFPHVVRGAVVLLTAMGNPAPTSASGFRTWCVGAGRSPAGCGNSSTGRATAPSCTTRSRRSRSSWVPAVKRQLFASHSDSSNLEYSPEA
jgi:Fe-S-cluster containining protein